jgi:anti-sigma factor RsiW
MTDHHPTCRQILAPLSDYLSGEAAASLCAEIEAHLAQCQDCRAVVDTLRKTIHLYRTAPGAELPAGVRRRLYHVLDLDEFLVE